MRIFRTPPMISPSMMAMIGFSNRYNSRFMRYSFLTNSTALHFSRRTYSVICFRSPPEQNALLFCWSIPVPLKRLLAEMTTKADESCFQSKIMFVIVLNISRGMALSCFGLLSIMWRPVLWNVSTRSSFTCVWVCEHMSRVSVECVLNVCLRVCWFNVHVLNCGRIAHSSSIRSRRASLSGMRSNAVLCSSQFCSVLYFLFYQCFWSFPLFIHTIHQQHSTSSQFPRFSEQQENTSHHHKKWCILCDSEIR